MVEFTEEERQINGNDAQEEQDDLEAFDQSDDGEVQASQFFSQNPYSQQLAGKQIAGIDEVSLNEQVPQLT